MRRDEILTMRLGRPKPVAEHGGVAEQQVIAIQASADTPCLLAAGDLARAGGGATVSLRHMPLRAASESGSEGVPAETELESEAWPAETLKRMGALADHSVSRHPRGRP